MDIPKIALPRPPARLVAEVVVVAALIASLAANAFQWREAGIKEATAPLANKIFRLELTAAANSRIATMRAEHDKALAAARARIAEASKEDGVRYERVIQRLPAPACAPGKDRVAAWNEIAGER